VRAYTRALEDISLVKLASFMKSRVIERARGCTKRQCIWIIEDKAVKNELWFINVLMNFVKKETGSEDWKYDVDLNQLKYTADVCGNAASLTEIGNLYRAGYPPLGKNEQLAFLYYMKAAVQNDPLAQMCVAVCYEIGTGVPKNAEKAFEWFYKARLNNVCDALYKLGMCHEDGVGTSQDHVKAFECYSQAAEHGDAIAQNNVGVYYDRGTGVKRSAELAVYWYEKAAEQGHASAQNNFGACLEEGVGVKKSLQQAIHWYTKAANQGDQMAQNNLGYCYQEGIGVAKDPDRAIYYYQQAALQGYEAAQTCLGKCYYKGYFVSRDYQLSAYWFSKALEQGSDVAHYYLGKMYLKGSGVPQNLQLAYKLFSARATKPKFEKALKQFTSGHLLNSLLVEEWPSSFVNLHPTCRQALMELLLVSRYRETYFPKEVYCLIVHSIILLWPFPHVALPSSPKQQIDIYIPQTPLLKYLNIKAQQI